MAGILTGDGYSEAANPTPGDVGLYKDSQGIVHSVTVTKLDAKGNVASVSGLGGVEQKTKTTSPAAAWPGATIEYYHKDKMTDEERAQQVNRAKTFEKKKK